MCVMWKEGIVREERNQGKGGGKMNGCIGKENGG